MFFLPYDRAKAVRYARKWALYRNPAYYDFELLGGDCTNFASQCIFAGCGVMNLTPTFGWYYRSSYDRAPAWTDVDFLFDFLTNNKGVGPFGREIGSRDILPGDIVQFGKQSGDFYHSPVITETHPEILVCAHSRDRLDAPLSSYLYERVRFIRIDGARRDG
ncbi:MAG: amidase [Clostridiales bacterium]|nr:amidase [Clostridiales bacterium]